VTEVRPVRPEEWQALRDLRLEALQDSPDAFWTRLADALERGEDHWRAAAAPPCHVADDEGRLVGMVSAFPDDDDPRLTHLIAIYVSPAARRRGLGGALVETQLAWARRAGYEHVALMVNAANRDAVALYERLGFRESGRRERMHGRVLIAEMTREL
jgi:ribosomal protein S18 acetylase RimI-like enzyme